jgi:hypothetical protein
VLKIFWQQLSKNTSSIRKYWRTITSFDFDSHYNPFRGIEVFFRVKTVR